MISLTQPPNRKDFKFQGIVGNRGIEEGVSGGGGGGGGRMPAGMAFQLETDGYDKTKINKKLNYRQ